VSEFITLGLNPAQAENAYVTQLLAQLKKRIRSGLDYYRREPAYLAEPVVLKCVEGNFKSVKSQALSTLFDNRLRKTEYDIASALTDVRPIWNYSTFRAEYKDQADTFSKLARFWWKKAGCDTGLFQSLLYSQRGGSGFLWQRWNPTLPGGGDMELVALGPRDVLPWGPTYGKSIQDWQGVIIRQNVDMADLVNQYPTKRYAIASSTGGWFDPPVRTTIPGHMPVASPMDPLGRGVASSAGPTASRAMNGTVDLMVAYFKDYARNTSDEPKTMGREGSSWTYTVQPGDLLYPRGRMVKFVEGAVLEDGPNPYWHGQFPLTRVTLLRDPELLLGLSLLFDVIPLNERLNEVLRCMDDGLQQWVRRPVKTNSSMAESKLKAIDSRLPGGKYRVNSTAGEDFEILDGPNFPNWIINFAEYLKNAIDENTGARGLRNLDQLKQMPSGDTLEKYMESLTPMIAQMARSVELSLAEVADQFIMNAMQFYPAGRRYQTLGASGLSLEDFDFNPANMVPSKEGDTVESLPERAIEHKKNFIFDVAPNTFLNVSNSTKQLQVLQLFQRGAVDWWTLAEAFNLTGIGPWPAETIPERMVIGKQQGIVPGSTPEMVQAQQQAATAQALMAVAQAQQAMQQMMMQQMMGQTGQAPPQGQPPTQSGPPPPEGGTGKPVGRPGSAQDPPQLIERSDGAGGTRTVLSESR
jgi:hypothetical protein